MDWDERAGRVSDAFNDWRWVERDQRAFLAVSSRFAKEMYDRLWEEASSEPWYDGAPELVESFEDKVDGLWPQDFEWMQHSGIVKDAVTSFEVYLEKAREEVLRHDGEPRPVPIQSPPWGTLRDFFRDRLGVSPETPRVREVRNLRHFLTHRRGELRTEELRKEFAAQTEGFPPLNVELPEEVVVKAMDHLADAVRAVDVKVYAHMLGV